MGKAQIIRLDTGMHFNCNCHATSMVNVISEHWRAHNVTREYFLSERDIDHFDKTTVQTIENLFLLAVNAIFISSTSETFSQKLLNAVVLFKNKRISPLVAFWRLATPVWYKQLYRFFLYFGTVCF